jgi:DNA replication protein DnaC
MERSQLFDLMGELKLYGMKAAFDEIMATAIKRQHEPQRIIGDLLTAEVNEKQARSIKYQLTIAKLPLAKDLDDFRFEDTPINETLVRDLAGGDFIAQQRNAVLVGGTGARQLGGRRHSSLDAHFATAPWKACVRRKGSAFSCAFLCGT